MGAAALAAACGGGGPQTSKSSGPATLNFWKPAHIQNEAQVWGELLGEFTRAHPSIKVQFTPVPFSTLTEKFTAAFASGQPPDVFYLPDTYYPKYAAKSQIAKLPSALTDTRSAYTPNLWTAGAYRGTQYGVPFLAVVQALLLNVSLLKSAGIEPPRTWSQIRAAAKALTHPDKGTYGMAANSHTYFITLLRAGGVDLLDKGLQHVTANTKAGAAAWKEGLQQIGADDKAMVPVGFSEDQITALQLKGAVGIMWAEQDLVSTAFRTKAPNIELDVIPVPKVDGSRGEDTVWSDVGFMFMARDTPHPDAALELLEFVSSRDIQQKYVLNAANLISPMHGLVRKDQDPVVTKYLSYIAHSVGPPSTAAYADIEDKLTSIGPTVISGQSTPQQALQQLSDQIQPTLKGA